MCTVLLPPGDNPIAVNEIYHIIHLTRTGPGSNSRLRGGKLNLTC